MSQLVLKRAAASRPSGEWSDDDYDVRADGAVIGRIMRAAAAPEGTPCMWTLAFGHHEDRTPTHGLPWVVNSAVLANFGLVPIVACFDQYVTVPQNGAVVIDRVAFNF
jgi:hypothetical protein